MPPIKRVERFSRTQLRFARLPRQAFTRVRNDRIPGLAVNVQSADT
jgi:hypothetical protein